MSKLLEYEKPYFKFKDICKCSKKYYDIPKFYKLIDYNIISNFDKNYNKNKNHKKIIYVPEYNKFLENMNYLRVEEVKMLKKSDNPNHKRVYDLFVLKEYNELIKDKRRRKIINRRINNLKLKPGIKPNIVDYTIYQQEYGLYSYLKKYLIEKRKTQRFLKRERKRKKKKSLF